MTPRNKENKGLPQRWRTRLNARGVTVYYYLPRESERPYFDNKTEFKLGESEHSAYQEYASRIQYKGKVYTFNQLCDRYCSTILREKAPKTQKLYLQIMKLVRAYFGDDPVIILDTRLCLAFIDDVRVKRSQSISRKAFELLQVLVKHAVQWGVLSINPMRELDKPKGGKKDRYVSDDEFFQAFPLAPIWLQDYMILKLLTGIRQCELLNIKLSDLTEEGIYIKRAKGQKPSIYAWSDALRESITRIRSRPRKISSMYLFCTQEGKQYAESAFQSAWKRFMLKVTPLGVPKFTENDLRAKVASDVSLARAKELLGHSTDAVTKKHYRRKVEVIKPVR